MSIGRKLMASFGALALLLALIGAVTFWMMGSLAGSMEQIYLNGETSFQAANLVDHLQNLRIHALRASTAGTPRRPFRSTCRS